MADKFEQWAVVELFGHQVIAGMVSEQVIGGQGFVRVDVPAVNGSQAFTKFYGAGAIYAISPCDEATGGESGPDARPMDPSWARSDLAWCRAHDVKFMFKQWGEYVPLDHLKVGERTTFKRRPVDVNGTVMVKVGKALAGHVLDGQVYRWHPNVLGSGVVND